MNTRTGMDRTVLSDMHKDAYGFRPGPEFWNRVERMTEAQVQELFRDLNLAVETELEQEARIARASQKALEQNIQTCIEVGAGDRATALRWLCHGEGLNTTVDQDVEHFLWTRGIDITFWSCYMMEMGFTRKGMVWIMSEEAA